MSDDRFDQRLRALVRQLSRSVSESDFDYFAARLGVDLERVRGVAGVVEVRVARGPAARGRGPHPLDLPSDEQGRALSALGSGRWTVTPGSGRLAIISPAGGLPEPPENADLIGELCARDWITADGTVTLVGRHALIRWCQTVESGDRVVSADHDTDGV